MLRCLSVLETRMKCIFTNWVKIQAENCQVFSKKARVRLRTWEKNTTVHMQSCSLHRQTIKLFKYKMCLVHALVCTDGLKSSYAVCGGRALKSLSNRSKVWCCCKCHVSLSVDQQKSDEWFWGLSLCLSKTAVRLPHVMHLYITPYWG